MLPFSRTISVIRGDRKVFQDRDPDPHFHRVEAALNLAIGGHARKGDRIRVCENTTRKSKPRCYSYEVNGTGRAASIRPWLKRK